MNRYLLQQGYSSCTPDEVKHIKYKTRVLPLICLLLTLSGVAFNMPGIHFMLFLISLAGFMSRRHHPADYLYNILLSILNYQKLPTINPWPRRYASLLDAIYFLAIGLALAYGQQLIALVFCGAYLLLQLVLLITHFCLGSWLYEQLYSFLEHGDGINIHEARALRINGAILLDVRSPEEHSRQVITGAVNIPLPRILESSIYHNKEVIVFCRSGMRSREAARIINQEGKAVAYSLGKLENAIKL